MRLKTLLTLLLGVCLAITACSETLFVSPTSTATRTDTPMPTRIASRTDTPVPIDTISWPTSTPTIEVRTGTPVADWRGIPIMPNAIIGEQYGDNYVYTTKASQEEVKDYYVKTMQGRGWKNVEDYLTAVPGGKVLIVKFPNNDGGYLIEVSYQGMSVFLYIYEAAGITHVQIWLPRPYTPFALRNRLT